MNPLQDKDITLDPEWQAQNLDRLLAFEILNRTIQAKYQEMDPQVLADKVGMDKGFAYKMLRHISKRLNELSR